MRILQKSLKVPRKEYMRKHLEIISPLLPEKLTKMEIEVLALLMENSEQAFTTEYKTIICTKLKLSPQGLSNYISSLKKKGFIEKREVAYIPEYLYPEPEIQGYQFKLEISALEEENGADIETSH